MAAIHESELAWLRLQLTPGVGNVTARRLLEAFSGPEQIFAQSQAHLAQVVSSKNASSLLQWPENWQKKQDTLKTWLQMSAHHRFIPLGHEDYPQSLLHINEPPLILYVNCQNWTWWRSWCPLPLAPLLSVVGSRSPTPQGGKNAQLFSQALSQAGWGIVSGLALGVDGMAHMGALAAPGGKTIAVCGTGLDRIYPRGHEALAASIAANGALISEFPLGTEPLASNFPKRNRIIAGLGVGTIVVEAQLQSGSLITARLASEQGKEVFALPGSIHSPQAKGCHQLIKQGAKLVECVDDVLEELPPMLVSQKPAEQKPFFADAHEKDALFQILGYDPMSLEEIQARSGYPMADLQARLLALELQGLLHRLPGAYFQRMAKA